MNFIEAIHEANMAYIIPYHVRKKHLELLILTLIRACENTASSDHVIVSQGAPPPVAGAPPVACG